MHDPRLRLSALQEFCDECTNQTRLVRRDPALRDNSQLRPEFELRTGLQIYRGLREGFRVSQGLCSPVSMAAIAAEACLYWCFRMIDSTASHLWAPSTAYPLAARCTPLLQGETFSGVPPVLSISANLSQVLGSVQQLVNVFVQNGFALMVSFIAARPVLRPQTWWA